VTDPALFCREFLEFEPHPGQELWLRGSTHSQNLLVTGNRWGKSHIQAAKILHRAIFRVRDLRYDRARQYNILNLSITQDQSNIIFRKCLQLLDGKPLLELLVDKVTHTPFPTLTLSNGASVQARSSQNRGEHILGHDFDFINFDEVAFELHPDYVVDEILTMRLADRKGSLDLVSTPCGKNWFYRKYLELKSSRSGFVHSGSARDNPFIAQDYIEARTQILSAQRVQQNIEGQFVDSENQIISEQHLQQALGQARGLMERVPHHRYLTGWDLARKSTHTVGVTLDVTAKPYQVVAFERFNRRDWPEVYARIRARKVAYGGDTIIDSTGLGDVVVSEVNDIKPIGFIFTGKSKAELLLNLQIAFERGEVGLPFVETGVGSDQYWSFADELRDLRWEDNSHCDAAMALALALWGVRPGVQIVVRPQFKFDRF
jgi:hypothetical protein